MHSNLIINLAKIKANYQTIISLCAISTIVGASVKANAYGLGADRIGKALQEVGCRNFFVATVEEGIYLRKSLQDYSNIFILHGVSKNEARTLVENKLIPVLNNLNQIEIWRDKAKSLNIKLKAILHIDIGLNRLGLPIIKIEKLLLNKSDLLKNLDIIYIMGHMSASDERDNPYNMIQLDKFIQYSDYFKNIKKSLANSGAILLDSKYHFDLVRPGIALYGVAQHKINSKLYSPIKLTAPIIQIRTVEKGDYIGYNMTFKVDCVKIVAILAIGYADGYLRALSNKGFVSINNIMAPIVGRISMDYTIVDVSHIPTNFLKIGLETEIFGDNCDIEQIADLANSSVYEFMTRFGDRYNRTYIDEA